MEGAAIKVVDVSKSFVLPQEKHTSLKSAFIHFYRRRRYEKQQALSKVSFQVKRGEFLGIVGRNGSGKSTLLKLLAGIYKPSSGSIETNGTLVPFIELGVGFNMELTGRENVYLNGALLGFSRSDMKKMYKDIVEFAELERFMDQKLKNYSSGMQVRLAFSIAIRAESDILLLDEVLAVGDAAFQQKCFDYFRKLKAERRTVVFVSHDMARVQEFCDRALLIDNGRLIHEGNTSEVASQYLINASKSAAPSSGTVEKDSAVHFHSVHLRKDSGRYKTDEKIKLSINYELSRETEYDLGISLMKNGVPLHEKNTKQIGLPKAKGKHTLDLEISAECLQGGVYGINVAAFTKPSFQLMSYMNDAASFFIDREVKDGGLVHIKSVWSIEK